MKFTLSALRQHLITNCNIDEILETLNNIGFEVESVIDKAKDLSSFEVAEIISAAKHPSADKLQVCQVHTKSGIKQIVCGAKNARAGIKVVLAPVGTLIPNGNFVIKEAEIRGVKSSGMMCSFEELGLEESSEGIIELQDESLVGDNIARYLGIDDQIIDISVTPNRGDALSVYGIARDLAAAGCGTLVKHKILDIKYEISSHSWPQLRQEVPLFATLKIVGLENNFPTPEWMQRYLKNVGIKSISPVVDIINYLGNIWGRPMHAYDAAKIDGDLFPDYAIENENFKALSGEEYKLSTMDLVIRDGKNIQALAGIIGGELSSCYASTKSIIIESAFFHRDRIIESGRRYNINTESRYRFERNTDHMMIVPVLQIAASIIMEICGGQKGDIKICGSNLANIKNTITIHLTESDIIKKVGQKIDLETASQILHKLGFDINALENGIEVKAPSWRYDIKIKEDIIEEIVRIYGFQNIHSVEISPWIGVKLDEEYQKTQLVKSIMVNSGFDELVTFSFMNSKNAEHFGEISHDLLISNPISSELNYMRNSIIPNLVEAIKKNQDRNLYDLAIFEIGPVFKGLGHSDEKTFCSAVVCGNMGGNMYHTSEEYDVLNIKFIVERIIQELGFNLDSMKLDVKNLPSFAHPGQSAIIFVQNKPVGWFGAMHPSIMDAYSIDSNIVGFELDLSALSFKSRKKSDYIISDYQLVKRDLSLIVDSKLQVGSIIAYIKKLGHKIIKSVELFDVYNGDKIAQDKKSIAIELSLQSQDKTLTDEDINHVMNDVVQKLREKFNSNLRDF